MAATTTCGDEVRAGAGDVALQVGVLAGALGLYLATRRVTMGSIEQAEQNAFDILAFEARFGLDFEAGAQALIIDNPVMVTLMNWVYVWGHWPVLGVTAVWLFLNRRETFARYRNALVLSGLMGLVVFALYPVAPPRLLDIGMVDTVHDLSSSYQILQPPSLVNQYAAMPSFHVGWNVLVAIAVYHASRNPELRFFAAAGPVLMIASVVLTANHYILDAVAGIALVVVAWEIGDRLAIWTQSRRCDDRYTRDDDHRRTIASHASADR